MGGNTLQTRMKNEKTGAKSADYQEKLGGKVYGAGVRPDDHEEWW